MTRSPWPRGRLGEAAQQRVVGAARRAAKSRVQPVIILDRVEAAGEAGIMKRVDVDRVEPHRRDARQMRRPVRDRSGQGRKQIIDAQAFAHRPVSCRRVLDCRGRAREGRQARPGGSGLPHGACRRSGEADDPGSPVRRSAACKHRNLPIATRLSRTAPRCAYPGSASGPRHTFRRAELGTAAGKVRRGPSPCAVRQPRRHRQLSFKRRNCRTVPASRFIVCHNPVMRCRKRDTGAAPLRNRSGPGRPLAGRTRTAAAAARRCFT